MTRKKIIALALLGTTLAGTTVGYSAYSKLNSQKYFLSNGYVLSGTTENKNVDEVQYFSNGEKYTHTWTDTLEFKNTEGEKVTVESDNFIHYTNNDLSLMSKGVLMNTEDLQNEVVTSYSTPEEVLIKNSKDGYEISNLDETITVSDFIWKVSDEKYLIASDEIKLSLGKNKEETVSGYVELTYVDGGIVKLSNANYNYQTVASSAAVALNNGTSVNLDSKEISVHGEVKSSLTNMVVDSEDNVEIVQNNVSSSGKSDNKSDDNSGTSEGNKENLGGLDEDFGMELGGSTNNSETNTNETTNINGTTGGTVDSDLLKNILNTLNGKDLSSSDSTGDGTSNSGDSGAGSVVKFVDPIFEFTNFTTTPIGFDATLQITDDDEVISSGVTIQVFEKASNKLVYTQEESQGVLEIDTSMRNLKTGTDYIIKVSASYTFNGQEYNKIFIEKQFNTDSLGLKYSKAATTSSSVTVSVEQNSESKASKAEVALYNTRGEKVSSQPVEFDSAGPKKIEFTDLEVNSEYTVKLENIVYDSVVVIQEYDNGLSVRTLKGKPVIGNPVVKINKKDMTFAFSLDNLEDKYNGIQKITYEVYEVGDLENPVYTISRTSNTEAEVNVDNSILYKNTYYTVKATVTYYDNEKEVEYSTAYAETFSMEGAQIPSITEFRAESVRFDSITGKIVISDPDGAIPSSAKVTYSLSGHSGLGDAYSGETTVIRSGDEVLIPISKNGLRASQSYDLSVIVEMDLNDGSGLVKVPIGTTVVRTSTAQSMSIEFGNNKYSANSIFNFNMKLVNDDAEYEASTIGGMKINLYRGTEDNKVYKGTVTITDTNPLDYESSIKEKFYDNEYTVLEELFKEVNDDFTGDSYVVEVEELYDYTNYPNVIPIKGKNYTEVIPNSKPPSQEQLQQALTVTPRTKSQEGESDEKLAENTVVKLKLATDFGAGNTPLKVKYYIYADDGNSGKVAVATIEKSNDITDEVELNVQAGRTGNIQDDITYMKSINNTSTSATLVRGNKYYFGYEAAFDLDSNGTEDYIVTTESNNGNAVSVDNWVPKEVQVDKQSATLNMYPLNLVDSSNSSSTFKWKYSISYSDLDNTLKDNKITIHSGSNNKEISISNKNAISNTDSTPDATVKGQKTIEVDGLTTGAYRISGKVQTNKISEGTETNYAQYHFGGLTDLSNFKYTLHQVGENAFKITLKEGTSVANKIVSAQVKLKKKSDQNIETKEKEYEVNSSGEIIIPFSDIEEEKLNLLRGQEIIAEVKVKYDTGKINFNETNQRNALVQVSEQNGTGQYIYFTPTSTGANVGRSDSASTSIMKDFILSNNKMSFTGMTSAGYLYEFLGGVMTVSGLEGNNRRTNVVIKDISENYEKIEEGTDGETITVPEVILPTATITHLSTTINSVNFNLRVNQTNADKIEKFKVELYDSNDTLIGEKIVNKSEINSNNVYEGPIKFGSDDKTNMKDKPNTNEKYTMDLNSNYYIKVKADIKVNDKVQNDKELIDTVTGSILRQECTTIGQVDMTDFENSVINEENKKGLKINHQLSPVSVLDKMEYDLLDSTGAVIATVTKNKAELQTQMTVEFTKEQTENIILGHAYSVVAKPYVLTDNKEVGLPTKKYDFMTYNLSNPYTSFTYSSQLAPNSIDNVTADFTIRLRDSDKVMKNIKDYKITITDAEGAEVIPVKETVVAGATKYIDVKVNAENLKANALYKVTISAMCDTDLDLEYNDMFTKTYEFKTINVNGINVGDISLMQLGGNKLGIAFKNSIGLVNEDPQKGVKYIKYSLYNEAGELLFTKNESFVPTIYNENTLYVQTIDHAINTAGTYRVEMSLYTHNHELVESYSGQYLYGYSPRTSAKTSFISLIKNIFTR